MNLTLKRNVEVNQDLNLNLDLEIIQKKNAGVGGNKKTTEPGSAELEQSSKKLDDCIDSIVRIHGDQN